MSGDQGMEGGAGGAASATPPLARAASAPDFAPLTAAQLGDALRAMGEHLSARGNGGNEGDSDAEWAARYFAGWLGDALIEAAYVLAPHSFGGDDAAT